MALVETLLMHVSSTGALLAAVLLFLVVYIFSNSSSSPEDPPGPKPLPLLGNLLLLDLRQPHVSLCKLSKKYGSVFTVHFGPKKVVVLAGYKTVKQALVNQAEEFGERDITPIFQDFNHGLGIVFANGDGWKAMRRFALSALRDFGMGKKLSEEKIVDETRYLREVFEKFQGKPFDTTQPVNYAVSNIISAIVYGKRFEYEDPKFQDMVDKANKNIRMLGSAVIQMVLKHSKPVVLVSSHCSCVAGCALCNHLVALLYQTAHYSQLNIPAVPPVHSCTDTEQIWHKPRTLGVRPGPVGEMEFRKPRNSTTDCVRSSLYKALDGELPDLAMLRVSEVYKDFPPSLAPLVTTMGMSADVPLVQSAFGAVQAGSVLSFQHKPPAMREVTNIPSAPASPSLPIHSYRLEPPSCAYVLSEQEHLHLKSLEVSFNTAHRIEAATQGQSSCQEWHRLRKMRVTSTRFHEVCHVREHTSAENLAERILKGTGQTTNMRRGIDMEPLAVKEYCTLKNVNCAPCGFIVHPDAPWLGSSPDGVIFDPSGNPPFGLLEVKCPNIQSYVDCPYLKMSGGALKLRRQHKYYWQVQGQMLLTGLEWCDFVVCAQEDMLVERIYKDLDVMHTIRDRADHFFFYHYIQKCLH